MNEDVFGALIRLAISLPLVGALAYFFIRYGFGRQSFLSGARRHMRIIEQLSLAPKSGLALVQVGCRYYLLAYQESGVTVLGEFDELPEKLVATGQDLQSSQFFAVKWPGYRITHFIQAFSHFKTLFRRDPTN